MTSERCLKIESEKHSYRVSGRSAAHSGAPQSRVPRDVLGPSLASHHDAFASRCAVARARDRSMMQQ
jgi:hypothetical protein